MDARLESLAWRGRLVDSSPEPSRFEQRKIAYFIVIPLLYLFGFYAQVKTMLWKKASGKEPSTNLFFIDGLSKNSRRVKEGHARWPALDAVYNFHGGEGNNRFTRWLDDWWLHIRNAQAVRNRLINVKSALRQAIFESRRRLRGEHPVRVLSLAAGSAQAVLDCIAEIQRDGSPIAIEITFVDADKTAIAEIRRRADQLGLTSVATIERGLVEKFVKRARTAQKQYDIIEMCGYMDYFSVEDNTILVKEIHETLPDNGFFLGCHVHWNHEAYFLEHVEKWWMWYKPLEDLAAIVTNGGFKDPGKIMYLEEPLKIHTVVVAQK